MIAAGNKKSQSATLPSSSRRARRFELLGGEDNGNQEETRVTEAASSKPHSKNSHRPSRKKEELFLRRDDVEESVGREKNKSDSIDTHEARQKEASYDETRHITDQNVEDPLVPGKDYSKLNQEEGLDKNTALVPTTESSPLKRETKKGTESESHLKRDREAKKGRKRVEKASDGATKSAGNGRLAEENRRLASEVFTLQEREEEISQRLEAALRNLDALKAEKHYLEESLKVTAENEVFLRESNKELQEENEELKSEIDDFADDLDALEDDLEEEVEFSNMLGEVLQQRSNALKVHEAKNILLEKRLETAIATEAALAAEIKTLQKELESMGKLEEDHRQSMIEKIRLQDQVDGLREIIENSNEDLTKADCAIKDLEIKVLDRSFTVSLLTSEVDAAFEELRKTEETNKLNLQSTVSKLEENANKMRDELQLELKCVKTEKEEEQRKLTDRIAGLRDALEGTSEELVKALEAIKDMQIKGMDDSFRVSELSRELDAALERQRQLENNYNPKLDAIWNTQVTEHKAQIKKKFGKYMRDQFDGELKLFQKEKDDEINIYKEKADELTERLKEVQLNAENVKLDSFSLQRKIFEQERIIEQLKLPLKKSNKSNECEEEKEELFVKARTLSQEWDDYYYQNHQKEESRLRSSTSEFDHLVKMLKEKTFFLGGCFD
eukprot:CAMPEP_0172414690 /NCGR_PEP_ID=MMETSP1064-20121228/1326_1 /TAXON_ID=202472 /ORGANISM="Aulacoseira subarctica , Strain CCAP 1002/5" /LENGTH=671 /DNA_ID=CAMNT_0013151473 /DNA_START=36 /DNA_END=2051 /DNA_ORIENTATION=-